MPIGNINFGPHIQRNADRQILGRRINELETALSEARAEIIRLKKRIEYFVDADERAHRTADYWHDKYEAALRSVD